MMKRPRLRRPFYVSLLAIAGLLFLSYFPLARIRAANAGATILPSAGKPLVNLQNPQNLKITYTGSADAVAALQAGTATPTALAAADFDADGAMDVVAGYSGKSGGYLVLFRGNPDAYAPTDLSLYAKALKGNVPATFLPKASVLSVPESPDLLVTGDFNRDGYKDVLLASRGGSLYLLAGDGRGNLLAPQIVPLAGQVMALGVAGDGHVAVSVESPSGSQLVVLGPTPEGLTAGAIYTLPAQGDSIAWGNLGGGLDLAVGAGANVVMIYNALHASAQTETVTVPFNVQALAVGDFIWDQDNRTEIAVLADDGTIHILQHGTLNTAPLTAAQIPGRRAAVMAKDKLPTNPTSLGAWSIAKQLPYTGAASAGPVSSSALSSPRVASSSTHDLMVLDAGRSQLHILDTSGKTASPSADISFSGTPVAALVMPQKINSDRDIVVLTSSQPAPMLVTSSATLTLNVNTTADIDSTGICTSSSTTIPNPLSLRAAVCIANNSAPDTTTINIGAGAYDLTSLETGELQQTNSDSNGYSLTIVSSGTSANSFIQQTDGHDRILEQDPGFTGNFSVTFENVTLDGGDCSTGTDCSYGGGFMLGGGPSGSPDNITLTNVVVSDNTAGYSALGENGGAMDISAAGTYTFTNCTFSNNTAIYHGAPQDGGGVGGAFDVANNASGGNMTVTNCTFTGNISQNGGGGAIYSVMGEGDTTTISGSTFTGNSALDDASDGGAQGGAIHADGDMTVSNSRITGNTDGDGSSFGTGLYASNSAGFTVTATDNWWGCNGGPGASGCDTADDEAGTLTANPWLVLSISASSTQIDENGTSNLTANLTENSNNVGGFSVPNGTPVTFGGTLGTDNPTSTTLTSGEATSVYTAGNTAGDGSGTATVDNATVSVTIDIGAPPAITSSNNATFTLGAAGTFNVTTSGSPTPSISQSGALPSGVSFHDNGNGTGTLSGTPTQAGTFNTITFTASNGFLPNATQTFTLTVSQASTSIAVTNVNPASEAYGQDVQVTITAVLSWTGSGPAPTASDVTIGGNGPSGYSATNCGAPSGDTLTCTATYTPTAADAVGSYTETASFSGDSNYSGSSSPQTNNFSITQASSSTSVGSSQNPSVVGESVTFTATIDGEYGLIVRRNGAVISRGVSKRGVAGFSQKQSLHPVPPGLTGTVTWSANTGCSPSAVSGDPGTSQCTTTTLPQGTDTIAATYSGDTNHSGSTGTLSGGQVVNPSVTPTSIAVTNVSPASEAYGQDAQVTITAVLSWTGSGPVPTASDITIGGNGPSGYSATSCGVPSGDTLTCTASYTPTGSDTVGTYTETASFSGDSNYTGSSSPQTNNFSITQASSSTSVGSSQNPSVVGESVTFTATIDGEYGLIVRRNGAVISRGVSKRGMSGITQTQSLRAVPAGLTGTVTWSANTGCSPSAVSGDPGTSQCVTTTLPQGTDTITATYSGDTNHSGSTGTLSGGQQVNPQPPEVSVTPSSINFGTVHLLDLQEKNVTVKNIGTSPVTFTSVSLTLGSGTNRDDFTFVNFCPKTLEVGKSCILSVVFFARNVGSLSATLNINDNAAGSPQQVGLSATVINPRASFNPGSLNFGTVQVGHSSTKNVTLTNTGTTTLDITSVNVTGTDTGDFTRSNACPSSLAAGTDCIISVTFTPTTTGARSADLTVVDNAAISTQNVPLSGRGSN